jgi:ATP/maltotriose-dependent transcriptional regulator MalT
MSETPSLPSVELAAALADEGRRVLLGHWVAASVEPLQRSLETLQALHVEGREAQAAHDLAIEVLGWLNIALDAGGCFEAAAAARADLQRRMAEQSAPLAAAIGLWTMSCAAQLRGDVGAMLRLGEQAMRVTQEQETLPVASSHHALLGWALVMDGEVDEGLDELHASAVLHHRHGSAIGLPWLMTTCAEAHLAAGALREARRDIESAHAALVPGTTTFMQGSVWRVRGNLRWAAGEGLAAAWPDWQQALAIDSAAGAPLCELQTLLVLGRALAASGEKVLAGERLGEMLAQLDAGTPASEACPLVDIARRQLAAWA